MGKRLIYEKILKKRLEEHNLEFKDIISKIEIPLDDETAIFFYTSHFEGLGTKKSDIDIYIISNHKLNRKLPGKYLNCEGVITYQINNLEFDLEYWDIKEINSIITECQENAFIENDLLKILVRLNYGYSYTENSATQSMLEKIQKLQIEKIVTGKYALLARSNYDDALKMFYAGEYVAALDCCRRALWDSVSALNSANGHSNLKEKWISKIFLDNNAYGNKELLDEYYKYQVYSSVPSEHIENYVEDFLESIQGFITEISFSNK